MLTILFRELIVACRRGTPYALLTANGVLLAGLAAAVAALSGTVSPWIAPSIGATSAPVPTGFAAVAIAWRGPSLFLLLAAWLALLTAFVAPASGARTITPDRDDSVLESLVGSGISMASLVIGKWLGGVLQVALVLISGVPAFALAWLFGGVGPKVVLLTIGVLVAHAGLLVAFGMLGAVLLDGELLPTAVGSFLSTLVFLGTAVALVAGLVNNSSLLVMVGVGNPLLGLLGANQGLAEALAKAAALPGPLPLYPTTTIAGRILSTPVPIVTAALYGAGALLLLPLVAIAIDPYHPLKTIRLRQQEPPLATEAG